MEPSAYRGGHDGTAGRRANPAARRSAAEGRPGSPQTALSALAAACTARGRRDRAAERGQLKVFAETQRAEEASVLRRARRLLALLSRTGRADAEAMAEAMFQLTKGRTRLPAGSIAATMILAAELAKRGRRRVRNKPRPSGGRRWAKGLHPGLWHAPEISEPQAPAFQSTAEPPPPPEVGVVAVR